MDVKITIEIGGSPPLVPDKTTSIVKCWSYTRDVRDYERFAAVVDGLMRNEMSALFREALEEFRSIGPEAFEPAAPRTEPAPPEATAPAELPATAEPGPAAT